MDIVCEWSADPGDDQRNISCHRHPVTTMTLMQQHKDHSRWTRLRRSRQASARSKANSWRSRNTVIIMSVLCQLILVRPSHIPIPKLQVYKRGSVHLALDQREQANRSILIPVNNFDSDSLHSKEGTKVHMRRTSREPMQKELMMNSWNQWKGKKKKKGLICRILNLLLLPVARTVRQQNKKQRGSNEGCYCWGERDISSTTGNGIKMCNHQKGH